MIVYVISINCQLVLFLGLFQILQYPTENRCGKKTISDERRSLDSYVASTLQIGCCIHVRTRDMRGTHHVMCPLFN